MQALTFYDVLGLVDRVLSCVPTTNCFQSISNLGFRDEYAVLQDELEDELFVEILPRLPMVGAEYGAGTFVFLVAWNPCQPGRGR